MSARLVQIAGERSVATWRLPRAPFRIGRDPDSDVSLHSDRVSRQHALIEPKKGGHVVLDLGTPNGTTVNEQPVRGRAPLKDGDRIAVAGVVTFRYEHSAPDLRPWTLGAVAIVTAVVVFAAAQLIQPTERENPAWSHSSELALSAIEASEAEEPVLAKARLKLAVGVLYKAGHLDDAPRRRVMEVGLERIGARLAPPRDLVVLYRQVELRTEQAAASDQAPCRLDRTESAALEACLQSGVEWLFAQLHQSPTEIPPTFIAQVGKTLRVEHDFLSRALERREPLVPMLTTELERLNMPGLLHYVALIESGYRSDARSPAGALGLWQFMAPTARDYGLRVDAEVDQRLDPVRSTRAAAQYLQHLVFEFGSDALVLALAGYNYGQNRVRTALKQLEDPFSDRSYWRLVERGLLPQETAAYVTRYASAALAGEAGLPHPDALRDAGY